MATFDAAIERAVALELRRKTLDLYFNILPIWHAVSDWTLNGLDPALPLPYDVKIQLDAFKALTLDRLKLEPWITTLQTAQPGDTLSYPTPPGQGLGVYFDETLVFDENLIF